MKLYLIAGKEYAVSGDSLYEKVPEHVAFDESESTSTLAIKRSNKTTKLTKQVRKYIPKQGYKKGTCGKCGEEGHSAWKCPQRTLKKKGGGATKHTPIAKAKTKYDGDEVLTLARRVANKDMTPQEAADKLGVSMAMWYYLRNKFAGGVVAKQKPETKVVLDADEIREKVVELQEQNKNSLQIAQELHIPLSTVNKYWIHDRLAPASAEDAPEEEEVEEEDETI